MLLPASSNTHGSTLTSPAIQTLVHAFICTRVDFSNSLLYGTSAYLLDRLQSVLNSAARLILRIGKYDPISAAIRRDLHWLPVPFRIRYKLNSITSNCLAGRAPEYLIELCHSVTDIPARRNLRSSSQVQLLVPRYRKERSGKRGFSVSSPQLWNLLPADIRLLHNEHQLFRKRLKNSLYATVHAMPLRIYVNSVNSTSTTTTTLTRDHESRNHGNIYLTVCIFSCCNDK